MRVDVTVRIELAGSEEPKPEKPLTEKVKPTSAPVTDQQVPVASAESFPSGKLMKLMEVQQITGLSRGELETAVALGTLPKPKRIGRGKFWTVAAVHDFLAARRAEQSK